jgi:hypothetical protein
MRGWTAGVLGALCVLVAAWSWPTTTTLAQTETVEGRVICLVCFARNKANTGHDHDQGLECARACVRWEGNPAALLATDGKVYQFTGGLIANNNEKIAQYLADTVRVTGRIYEKEGMTMIESDDIVRAAATTK